MIIVEAKEAEIPRAGLARFVAQVRRKLRLTGEVNLLVTSSDQVRQLNAQFRGKDQPTDVLSFPGYPESRNGHRNGNLTGELAISAEIAAQQAVDQGHDLLTEVKILALHGMLHLAGHDHDQDQGEMRALEAELRQQFGLPLGLIERNSDRPSTAKTKKAQRGPRRPTAAARRSR